MSDFNIGDLCAVIAKSSEKRNKKRKREQIKEDSNKSEEKNSVKRSLPDAGDEIQNTERSKKLKTKNKDDSKKTEKKVSVERSLPGAGDKTQKKSKKLKIKNKDATTNEKEVNKNGNICNEESQKELSAKGDECKQKDQNKKRKEKKIKNESIAKVFAPPDKLKSLHSGKKTKNTKSTKSTESTESDPVKEGPVMDMKIDKESLENTFTVPENPTHLGQSKKAPNRKRKEEKMARIQARKKKSLPTKHPDDEKRTIFVGNVDCEAKRKQINKFFTKYGKVETVRLRNIPVSELNMSKKEAITTGKLHEKRESIVAFVRFKSEDSVSKALAANGEMMRGRHIRVDKSVSDSFNEKNSVFIGNLCFEAENENVHEHFSKCGKITNIRIVRSKETGASKGFGFVAFETKDAVELALQMEGQSLYNKPLRIKRAVKKEKVKKEWRPQGSKNSQTFLKGDKPDHLKEKYQQNRRNNQSYAGDKATGDKTVHKKSNNFNKTDRLHKMNAGILSSVGGSQNKRIVFDD